jgi:hypothetical protein
VCRMLLSSLKDRLMRVVTPQPTRPQPAKIGSTAALTQEWIQYLREASPEEVALVCVQPPHGGNFPTLADACEIFRYATNIDRRSIEVLQRGGTVPLNIS